MELSTENEAKRKIMKKQIQSKFNKKKPLCLMENLNIIKHAQLFYLRNSEKNFDCFNQVNFT